MTTAAKPFPQLPEPGDIVWCLYPELPRNPGQPGPKPRPALILKVSEADHEVMVVYGTSQKTHRIYPTEFVLKKVDPGFALSGLAYDTKFDMSVRIDLPYDSDWFDLAPIKNGNATTSPVMGALHPTYMDAVRRADAEVQKAA
ncbi:MULTISPECIES: type II toxin-antitoxin system PemK/MazF family toxin [Serratia]|uniref:type II toxin-antitoxin system PemK/MazF family toxin n=1 Tax=Serratia TaxID=613 RepID=UPI0029D71E9C|nr:type II toxin-antitoxin system PemK/MazF family toxin [Serratia marcescens]MDX7489832.1 type II toxin-antitoxin system PemK/MazF family toxin [Serratia marcescens]